MVFWPWRAGFYVTCFRRVKNYLSVFPSESGISIRIALEITPDIIFIMISPESLRFFLKGHPPKIRFRPNDVNVCRILNTLVFDSGNFTFLFNASPRTGFFLSFHLFTDIMYHSVKTWIKSTVIFFIFKSVTLESITIKKETIEIFHKKTDFWRLALTLNHVLGKVYQLWT